jgi:glycosyltransferase involved in cell wall biosynthesis
MAPCRFSIIITCCNQREFIRDAVNSALSLRNADKEVIVVDDGSTDGSREILEEYAEVVHLVPLQTNQGKGAARNRGAAVAKGDYLLFLDGDDAFLPWALDVCQRVVKARKPKLILCPMSRFEGPLPPMPPPPEAIRMVAYADYMHKDRPFCVSASSVVIERQSFEKVQGWANERFVMQDQDLVMRLGDAGTTAHIVAPPTILYRDHARQTVKCVPAFIDVLHQLIDKERSGRYPGGPGRHLERSALLGGLVYFWTKRALQARLYWDAVILFGRASPMVLAAIVRRAAAIVKGRRPCETLDV